MSDKVSVIIPAYREPFLQKTIDDLLENAAGDIEVVLMLDSWWPSPPIKKDPRVIIFHSGDRVGMRRVINAGASIAKGKYLMKCDAHCVFASGFDDVLKADCAEETVLVPVRYDLDVEHWVANKNKKYEFQYIRRHDLKGKNWPRFADRCNDHKTPLLMTTQGSCWFMQRKWFERNGGLDDVNFGSMGREAQEVTIKTWLAGGSVLLDRATWYAHWSKPKEYVIGARKEKAKSAAYARQIWTEDILKPLIGRFAPVPTWDNGKPKGMGRADLYTMFAEMGFKRGAEIGVWDGNNAKVMFQRMPGVKLFLVDPYEDYPLARRNRGKSRLMKAKERSARRLESYDGLFMYQHSEEAAAKIDDESLDFVYIDGNHKYDYVMLDIILWERKVRKGGIVSGHDYYNDPGHRVGVRSAVDDYVRAHGVNLQITDRMAEPNGRRAKASWWWKKE